MELRDLGLFGAVIVGGLAIGWFTSEDPASAPAPSATGAQHGSAGAAPAAGGGVWSGDGAASAPAVQRTAEGAALDANVQARAGAAFQAEAARGGAEATAAPPTWTPGPRAIPTMAPPAPGSAPSGGWGVQAGVAPSSGPMAPPAPPAASAPAPAADQPAG